MSRLIPVQKQEMTEIEKNIRNTAVGKLVVTNYLDRTFAFLIRDNRLLSMHLLPQEEKGSDFYAVGGIYIGKVKDITQNINACFVEIGKDMITFLPLSDIKNPVIINRTYDGRILCGDEILVELTKEPQKGKRAQVSTRLSVDFSSEEGRAFYENAIHRTCYSCIKKPVSALEHLFRTRIRFSEFDEVVTDLPKAYQMCMDFFIEHSYEKAVRLYQDKKLSLSKLYALQTKIQDATQRRIWLKSGGYLVLDNTEAMTVIDVNSGKYESKGNKETYYNQVNKEAAIEIAHQLRLRNLSGMILIDFINMKSKHTADKELISIMKEAVREDVCQVNVLDITALGLMELTRKKTDKPLWEQLKVLQNSKE